MNKSVLMAVLPVVLAACSGEVAQPPAAEDGAMTPTLAEGEPAGAELAAVETNATCKIESIPGQSVFEGPCALDDMEGPSFVVTAAAGTSFVDGVTEFVIEADTPDAAGMSARTADGELASLGIATRTGTCWESETAVVCVE